jgi:hypothetical protein
MEINTGAMREKWEKARIDWFENSKEPDGAEAIMDIKIILNALDACRAELKKAKARAAVAMLALEKAALRVLEYNCPSYDACKHPDGKRTDEICLQCWMETTLQQATEEIAGRGGRS